MATLSDFSSENSRVLVNPNTPIASVSSEGVTEERVVDKSHCKDWDRDAEIGQGISQPVKAGQVSERLSFAAKRQ